MITCARDRRASIWSSWLGLLSRSASDRRDAKGEKLGLAQVLESPAVQKQMGDFRWRYAHRDFVCSK